MQDMPSTEDMIAEVQGPEPVAEAAPEVQAEAQAQAIQEFEYQANGKTIKEPIDQILKRASQGYNYAQHMQDLKTKQTELDTRYQKAVELEQKYAEIDQFAQENPDWNDHLHKTWEARFDINGNPAANPTEQPNGVNSQFLQEFNEMKSFVENIKAQQADQAYQESVNKVQQSYPDVDFQATDPDTGRTLEQQVLDYAQENGIGRFEPAFKAFYSDKLIEQARMQAKEQMAGDIQKRTKAGLLGTSQAPARSSSDVDMPHGYKNMSMDQLHNWIVDKYAN